MMLIDDSYLNQQGFILFIYLFIVVVPGDLRFIASFFFFPLTDWAYHNNQ